MLQGIPGMGKLMDGWNGFYGGILDGWEWTMQQADAAWDYTRDAAIHVAQDVDKAVGYTAQAAIHIGQDFALAGRDMGRMAMNNPVSLMARNLYQHMVGDHRRSIQPNDVTKKDAKSAVDAAKSANPAELAKLKAAYIKNDPEQIERYVGAENKAQKEAAFQAMSPKAQAWVENLQPTDLWSLKGKSAIEIAAHMAGDKAIVGVEKVTDYYHLAKTSEAAPVPKPEAPKDKTVSERRAERTAAKLAKRPGAANVVTPDVAGTVPGQSPEVASTAQQEVMNFFGPRVAKPEEVSEYSQSQLPAYRPPVPMQRKA
ncbi:hypothetical protein [Rhizobium sp. RU36D]|uniref:hypothetical protein n=1 Tax=Rhizobium sp. RU36D TaxID=1907415 RepID=UPI001179F760|nr:hypothetical protein [Rhizobium sp. RU36D]